MNDKNIINLKQLVGGQEMLNALFSDQCRPKVRTLEKWRKKRRIPYVKAADGKIYYDIELCREHMLKKNLIRAA